jgi:hypothetical protein
LLISKYDDITASNKKTVVDIYNARMKICADIKIRKGVTR